jgi:hypothetical protein
LYIISVTEISPMNLPDSHCRQLRPALQKGRYEEQPSLGLQSSFHLSPVQ